MMYPQERFSTKSSLACVANRHSRGVGPHEGRFLPPENANLELTYTNLSSAGGILVKAMQTTGYGHNMIDEIL